MSVNAAFADSTATSARSARVSWPAIFAGAVIAAATSLVLLLLGSGLGLAMVSPWSMAGVTVTTFAVSTAVWIVVVQWLSSALGGYVAGRLRLRMDGVHPHEVFFRDTAHGLLTWALATLLVAGLMGSAITSVLDRGASAVGAIASGTAQVASSAVADKAKDVAMKPGDYLIDTLFRPVAPTQPGATPTTAPANADALRSEAANIIGNGMISGQFSDADKAQLASVIAARTGMSQADAQKRVDDTLNQLAAAKVKAQAAADTARKAALMMTLMTCLSLIIGAFVASAAAALGGSLRDDSEPDVQGGIRSAL